MASKTAKELVITKESGGQIKVNYPLLKRASLTLRALNHPLRRQMVQLIEDKRKLTVTELYVKLRLEQSVASQHLAILRRAQIVKTQREGKFIWYTTNKKRIEEINKLINALDQPE